VNFIKSIFVVFQLQTEPLNNYLHEELPDVELINNVENVPEVREFDDKN
jgi:hypothetical protein